MLPGVVFCRLVFPCACLVLSCVVLCSVVFSSVVLCCLMLSGVVLCYLLLSCVSCLVMQWKFSARGEPTSPDVMCWDVMSCDVIWTLWRVEGLGAKSPMGPCKSSNCVL